MLLICGPCVIENEKTLMNTARSINSVIKKIKNVDFYFKASCIKDNRTKLDNYYGPGFEEGLRLLEKVSTTFNVKITTDFHDVDQINHYGYRVDLIQIPAFLAMQTSIINAAVKRNVPLHIKKPQSLSPFNIGNIVNKVFELNENAELMITDRGTSFGFDYLIMDPRFIRVMQNATVYKFKVLTDVTHPNKYWRNYTYAYDLAKSSVVCGTDGLFIECHIDPENALCDADSQIPAKELKSLLKSCGVANNA